MSSLREYRKKIKTVKSTQQITKAMKMVSAARLRRAQSRILSARPFAIKMCELISDLVGRVALESSNSHSPHPLLQSHISNKTALLLVTADKGLCGSFNNNIIKKASEFLKENEGREIKFFVVGRKGRDFFKRLSVPLLGEYVQIFNNLSYTHAEIIGKDLIDTYLREELAEVVLIYNEFKSVIQQKLVVERLLPISAAAHFSAPSGSEPPLEKLSGAAAEQRVDFLYEPTKEKLLEALMPRYVKSQIFRVLLESFAAELGARMAAMDSATNNAAELLDFLTLKLNRTRQAIITRELAELVGGAEALK